MKQYSISILKKEWAKYRGLSLQRLMEKYVFPRKDMYDVQVVQEIPYDIQNPQELIEIIIRPWAEQKLFRNINGIILEINNDGISTARYIEENGSIVMPDYYMSPEDFIGMDSKGIHVLGFPNESWYPLECINLDGMQLFLLDSERLPNIHEYLVVNGQMKLIIKTMQPGFGDLLVSQIREKLSVLQRETSQTIEMAREFGRIRDNNIYREASEKMPENDATLSLREKMEIRELMKKR